MLGRARLVAVFFAAGVSLVCVGAGVAVLGPSHDQVQAAARTSGDGGSATYSRAGPAYAFDLTNFGTTTWQYVYLVGPSDAIFTSGQVTSGGSAPCLVGQPDGQPNEIECGPFSSGGTSNTHVLVTSMLKAPVACCAPFQFYVNSTGSPPYTRVLAG